MELVNLNKHQIAKVKSLVSDGTDIEAKLREIGFAEGDEVEITAYGPIAKTPICVRLNQTLVALRPNEAKNIIVEIV